jgi:DNA-directed RNA polymerase subunit RPC12/RpoP
LQEFIETMQASALCCPNCGSYLVKTTEDVETTFLYGDTRELTCEHPVRICVDCGTQWTDMEFEYIQTEAVLQHLKEEMATMHEQLAHHQAYPDIKAGKVEPAEATSDKD